MEKTERLQKNIDKKTTKADQEYKELEIAKKQLESAKEAFDKNPLDKKTKKTYERAIKDHEKAQKKYNKVLEKVDKYKGKLDSIEEEKENRKQIDVNNDPNFYKAVQLLSKYPESYKFIKSYLHDTHKEGKRSDKLQCWDLEAAYGGWYIEHGNNLFDDHYRIMDPRGFMMVTGYGKSDSDFEDAVEAYIKKYNNVSISNTSNANISIADIKNKIRLNIEQNIESFISSNKSVIDKEIDDLATKILVLYNDFPMPKVKYDDFDNKLKNLITIEISKYDSAITNLTADEVLTDNIAKISNDILFSIRPQIQGELNTLKSKQLASIKQNLLLYCNSLKRQAQLIEDEVTTLKNKIDEFDERKETSTINLAYGEYSQSILENVIL